MMPLLWGRLLVPVVSSLALLGSAGVLECTHLRVASARTASSQTASAQTASANTQALKGYIRQWVSPMTVAETVQRLRAGLIQRGFQIRAELNHQRMARNQGRRIPANTALLVSKPSLDAVVMAANPLANLFIPFTIAVWDQSGTTRIGYWDPQTDIAALLEIKEGEAAAALADLQEILVDVIKETLP